MALLRRSKITGVCLQGLENGGIIMKNQKRHSRKLLSILLVLCMALTIVPITAFAAGVNLHCKISVTYTKPDYKAGDARRQQRR